MFYNFFIEIIIYIYVLGEIFQPLIETNLSDLWLSKIFVKYFPTLSSIHLLLCKHNISAFLFNFTILRIFKAYYSLFIIFHKNNHVCLIPHPFSIEPFYNLVFFANHHFIMQFIHSFFYQIDHI